MRIIEVDVGMNAFTRLLRFTGFILVEYGRSGRILVEIIAAVAAFYIFFRRWGAAMQAPYFFSTASLLMIALAFYTTTMIMGLGDRPQGYLILSRRIGRTGYLIGHYLAAMTIVFMLYGAISLTSALISPIADLDVRGWALGSLPLLLNTALVAALVALLSPMVLTAGWRLTVLAIVAIAFSGSLLSGPTMANLAPPLRNVLRTLQTVFSTPLLPAFTGFGLAVSRDYSGISAIIPLAQLSLTLGLLALALYAFTRREIILTGS